MRGYFYKPLRFYTHQFSKKYYLDFSPKSEYFDFDKNNLPKVNYNGEWVIFPVTVMNYFLGVNDTEELSEKHICILNSYIKQNTENNIFLLKHNFFEKNFKQKPIWYSSLPHSILFSLLCRLDDKLLSLLEFGLDFYFNSIFNNEIYNKGIFLEYPKALSQPQNGQMFGLFAYLDGFYKKLVDKSNLEFHIDRSYQLAKKQSYFFGWTKYNNEKIASPFYHNLHINQYKVLMHYDKRFSWLYYKAIFGKIFFPVAIFIKIIQKIAH